MFHRILVFIAIITIAGCKNNLFQKLEEPFSAQESAILLLERKEYKKALLAILADIPRHDRDLLLGDQLTPSASKQLLMQYFGKRHDRDTIFGIYGTALIGASGINSLQLTLLVSQLSKNTEKVGIPDILKIVLSNIPRSESAQRAIDTVILVNEITDDSLKPVSRLNSEVLVYLLAVSSRILSLDSNGDNQITTTELSSLSQKNSQSIQEFLVGLQVKVETILSKSLDESYSKLHARLTEFNRDISEEFGKDSAEKLKNYLAKSLLDGSGSFSINHAAEVFTYQPASPRITAKIKQLSLEQRNILLEKKAIYLAKIKTDQHGWMNDTVCDGLLFNSLYALGGGKPDLIKARSADNQWFRHHQQNCLSSGQSKSTISRDMIVGLLLWFWRNKNLDDVRRLIAYGQAHAGPEGQWTMGEGESSRVNISASFQEVIYLLRDHLENKPILEQASTSEKIWILQNGFEGHIDMLLLMLRGELLGGLVAEEIELLRQYTLKSPRNALYMYLYHLYTDGNMGPSFAILSDESLFPSSEMPTTKHRCTFYLWQREELKENHVTTDWTPCPDEMTVHSGIDFLFVSDRLLE